MKPTDNQIWRIEEKFQFKGDGKVWEIQEKYGSEPPADVMETNAEFIFKAWEVIGWRVLELFMFVMRETLGGDEIDVATATTVEEAKDLLAIGFDYITEKNGIMLFRKPKMFKA